MTFFFFFTTLAPSGICEPMLNRRGGGGRGVCGGKNCAWMVRLLLSLERVKLLEKKKLQADGMYSLCEKLSCYAVEHVLSAFAFRVMGHYKQHIRGRKNLIHKSGKRQTLQFVDRKRQM